MNWLTKALTAMRHPSRPPLFGGLLKRTRFDYRREVGDGLDSSVVTAPAMWIARALPEAVLEVTVPDREGNAQPVPSHKMLDLIQAPNPFYGDIALWMATVMMFAITGNAYWAIVRNGAGVPVELWFVPNWMIEPKYPANGSAYISHYEYDPGDGQGKEQIPFEDVVHFRHGIDPRNPRMGLSPMDGVIREIFIDLESSNFVASLLRNMGVPGVVISPKTGAIASGDDVEATKQWFKQQFGGDNRGGTLVMGAPTDVQAYGFNPQQMNMSEGRDVAEERVCACLGIPAAVVGFGAGLQATKVGATMEELRKLAWNNGVLPMARMFADELQRSLLGQFGSDRGEKVAWDTSAVLALQEDEDKKVERWGKMLASGAITVFDYRLAIGLAADESHRFYLRPISSIEVPEGNGRELAVRQAALSPAAQKSAEAGEEKAASDSAYQRGYAWALLQQQKAAGLQAAFEKRLTAFFGRLGTAAEAAAKVPLERDPDLAMRTGKALGEDDVLIQAILDDLGIERWQGELRQMYEAQYLAVATAENDVAERAGLGASLPDVVARSVIAAGGRRAGLVDLEEQTKDAMFNALAEGRAAGEGAVQLAGRIAGLVEDGPSENPLQRSRRIARTETKYAQNISTIERARAAGIETLIVYDGLLGPGRSLLTHIARNGSVVSIEKALVMADEEHPNGTLSFAPNFEE
ncbi:phage portal protein [Novosphingobium huizhouense]|uniref:phage portal protein n=1 Tax=Novosphingobium huizhouense TaxID=2866625 RepID=UPI001CD8D7C7|nr:phage portal protein [Novosphingobium huizhouense]